MIITFCGDNEYLILEAIAKLKKQTDKLAIVSLNGDETSLETIKSELANYSLFSLKRLVILYNPSKVNGFSDYLESAVIDDNLTVVIYELNLDKRKTYYSFLKNKTGFRQLNRLSIPALNNWLISYVKDSKGRISYDGAKYLIDRIGDNQLQLQKEVDKLLLYSQDITKDSIDLLTEASISSTIFELLDAAFSLKADRALKLYNEQRLLKMEPEQILAMMAWQLHAVATSMCAQKLTASEVPLKSGLSPYTLSKAKTIALRLSLDKLKQLVKDLADLDFDSKSGQLDLDEGLKTFIVSLAI